MNIYCCDPDDVNVITFKDVKDICDNNNLNEKIKHWWEWFHKLRSIFLMNKIVVLNLQKKKLDKLLKQYDIFEQNLDKI